MRRAAFAGSFDPPTLGHLDIISRASALFDGLVVVAAWNPQKKYFFTEEERVMMLRSLIKKFDNVELAVCPRGMMLVDFLKTIDVRVAVRGVRGAADYTREMEIAAVNAMFSSGFETILLPARTGLLGVSSSAVRELLSYKADISGFVTEEAAAFVKSKLNSQGAKN